MENKIDLSEVEFELENAEKFLICFAEFCEHEGYCPETGDKHIRALCFADRLPQFEPLLNHAIDIIREQRKLIVKAYATNGGDAA